MYTFEEFKNKRINDIMEKHNIDILIASSEGNVLYLSGFNKHKIVNNPQVYALYDKRQNKKIIVGPLGYMPTILETVNDIEVYCYGEFYFNINKERENLYKVEKELMKNYFSSIDEALIAAIKGTGIKKGKIGFDESMVKLQTWEKICSKYSEIDFCPGAYLFEEIRKIKHFDEISLIGTATKITEESLYKVIKNIEKGVTESEIGTMNNTEVSRRGATPNLNVVSIDERSAFSDTINKETKVKDGSIIRFDVGCVYKGYCSDMARTVVIGDYNKKYLEYYNYLLEGEESAINAIKPGVTAHEIFEIAVQTVRRGIPHYNRNHCGHGIGLSGYNPPLIAPGVLEKIEVGMVLCIETPYYELGWGGMQVEDTIVVEENGCRYLTKSDRNLIIR